MDSRLQQQDFARFLKTVDAPALQAVAGHWGEARETAPMPSWEKLNPARIAPHLSILWAYRYDSERKQFIGRLAGNGVGWGFEKSFRGTPMQDLWPAHVFELSHKIMMRVMSEPVLYRNTGALFKQGGRIVEGERIILPLGGAGVHGDGVLGASVYQYPLRTREHGPVELLSDIEEWFSLS